ncbi:MAG: phosphatase PAP2 family protein [Firmicutes bacterium]|nr:phosphatase PAP2 family protein [Bacillota bacterium]
MKDYRTRRCAFLGIIIILAAVCGFITWKVAAVGSDYVTAADLAVQQWFLGIRNGFLNVAVTLLTHTTDTITIVILCALLILSPIPGRLKYGLPVTLTALGDMAVYKTMKHIFLRQRPDVMYHLVEQGGYSFPSGHSATSVAVYGLLFYLIRRHCRNPLAKNVLSGICLFLAVGVGPSRLYVGVHWFTDVLAGWCIGGIAALTAILILEKLEERHESV